MKTEILRKIYLPVTLLIFALILGSCQGGQDKRGNQQLKEAKEQTTQNINRYNNQIQERIDYIDEELEEAEGELNENLKEARAELKKQQSKLDEDLQKVKEASIDNWNNVIEETAKTIGEARSKMNEISVNVRNWLDEAEEDL